MLLFSRKYLVIAAGCLFVSAGLFLLNAAHLLTSGIAGWSILLTHWLSFSFGQLFFLLNCPFFILSWFLLGRRFTLTSIVAIATVSLITELLLATLDMAFVPQWLVAPVAGGLLGLGLTLIMRHGAALGGVNVAAVWAEHRHDLHAGQTLFAADCLVALFGALLFTSWELIWSLLGFVVLSWTVGRYRKKSPLGRQQHALMDRKSRLKRRLQGPLADPAGISASE